MSFHIDVARFARVRLCAAWRLACARSALGLALNFGFGLAIDLLALDFGLALDFSLCALGFGLVFFSRSRSTSCARLWLVLVNTRTRVGITCFKKRLQKQEPPKQRELTSMNLLITSPMNGDVSLLSIIEQDAQGWGDDVAQQTRFQ